MVADACPQLRTSFVDVSGGRPRSLSERARCSQYQRFHVALFPCPGPPEAANTLKSRILRAERQANTIKDDCKSSQAILADIKTVWKKEPENMARLMRKNTREIQDLQAREEEAIQHIPPFGPVPQEFSHRFVPMVGRGTRTTDDGKIAPLGRMLTSHSLPSSGFAARMSLENNDYAPSRFSRPLARPPARQTNDFRATYSDDSEIDQDNCYRQTVVGARRQVDGRTSITAAEVANRRRMALFETNEINTKVGSEITIKKQPKMLTSNSASESANWQGLTVGESWSCAVRRSVCEPVSSLMDDCQKNKRASILHITE